MSYYREFESEEDYLNELWEAHLDGACQDFLQYKPFYCTYCQYDLDAYHAAQQTCPQCSHNIEPGFYCINCGYVPPKGEI